MLDIEKYDIIVFMRDIFRDLGIKGYIVGGAVRDMLLGVNPQDFDFVVELDEDEHRFYTAKIASETCCEYKYNCDYHTAKLLIRGVDVDFIMARSEAYEGIASKPRVWSSSLHNDLLRRDFTINSMAIPLFRGNGEIIDPFMGRVDLARGILRVHHERSFHDDPTRIFRGIKYAARLGFSFEVDTEDILGYALRDGVLDYLSNQRIKQELIGIFEEKNLNTLASILEKYKIMSYIVNYDLSINLKINNPQGKVSIRNLFPALFYNNRVEVLNEINERLTPGRSFLKICSKIKELEEHLNGSIKKLYLFLFNNQNLIGEEILELMYGHDPRIRRFLTCKDKISMDDVDKEDIKNIDRNINLLKVDKLIKLIGSEE